MDWFDFLRSQSIAPDVDATAAAVDSGGYKLPPALVVTDSERCRCGVSGMVERDSLVRAVYHQVYELRLVVTALLAVMEGRGGLADGELSATVEQVRLAIDKRYLGYEPGSDADPGEEQPFAGLDR